MRTSVVYPSPRALSESEYRGSYYVRLKTKFNRLRENSEREDLSLLRTGTEAAGRYLQQGERLRLVLCARTGGALIHYIGWAGIEPFLGDILQRRCFVYLTDRRILLVAAKGLKEKPGEVREEFLLGDLKVVRFNEGRHLFSIPTLVLKARGEIRRLNFDPPFRKRAKSLAEAVSRPDSD